MDDALAQLQLLASYSMDALLQLNGTNAILDLLTDRERECISWCAKGKTCWEIGKILSIKERTVFFHINNVIRKLSVNSRIEAVQKVSRALEIDTL